MLLLVVVVVLVLVVRMVMVMRMVVVMVVVDGMLVAPRHLEVVGGLDLGTGMAVFYVAVQDRLLFRAFRQFRLGFGFWRRLTRRVQLSGGALTTCDTR